MRFLATVSVGLLASSVVFGQAQLGINEAWEGFSRPEIMGSGFNPKLDELPLEGFLDAGTKAWSGHYWPSKEGSINARWNTPSKTGFSYWSPSKAEVFNMSEAQLAQLAPSEKLDLLNGNYDYPLKNIVSGSANPNAQDWAGICHGWAPASIYHNEPTPKVLTNRDGLRVPFGSADIKALLSYYYAFYNDSTSSQIGLRCFFGRFMGAARGCMNDLNAGAFHIVITNKLGLRKEGVLMDVDRYREVWNQPIVGYKAKVLVDDLPRGRMAASSAVREARVEMELFYVDESDPMWNVVHGTENQKIISKDLQYRLELDKDGFIVGGDWESSIRPDFLWLTPKATSFSAPFSRLPELLND